MYSNSESDLVFAKVRLNLIRKDENKICASCGENYSMP